MPGVDRKCITHHRACDCREEHVRKLIAEVEKLRRVAEAAMNLWDDCGLADNSPLVAALKSLESP